MSLLTARVPFLNLGQKSSGVALEAVPLKGKLLNATLIMCRRLASTNTWMAVNKQCLITHVFFSFSFCCSDDSMR